MEGSESEAIFESLNLSPQLFINEVRNVVDDLVDDAFNFYLQESSILLKTDGTSRSLDVDRGVSYLRNLIQSTLDQQLKKWEEYCLRFCFQVPIGFSLPKPNESSGDGLPEPKFLAGTEMETQLDSLREKLTLVGKESAELSRELHMMERQSLKRNWSLECIDEALHLYRENGTNDMLELATIALGFRDKLEKLKKRMVQTEGGRPQKLQAPFGNKFGMHQHNGLSDAKLEKLQDFLNEIKTS